MNHIENEEAFEQLRQVGWTASEIERLCRFRRDYVRQEQQITRNQRRQRLSAGR